MKNILLIHGPNLNLLGKRNNLYYGNKDLNEVNNMIKRKAEELNFNIEIFQFNSEGDIISKLHNAEGAYNGVIINPGAYTHYSIAIRDAVEILDIPVIEVHLSNIYDREDFRSKSVIAPVCKGQVTGFGYISYLAALYILNHLLKEESNDF